MLDGPFLLGSKRQGGGLFFTGPQLDPVYVDEVLEDDAR